MLPYIETRPFAEIKTFQEEKLKEQLNYLQEKSGFYR